MKEIPEEIQLLLKKVSLIRKEDSHVDFTDKSKGIIKEENTQSDYLVFEKNREGVSFWGKNRDPKTGRYILS